MQTKLAFRFLAAIPKGNRVRIEYYAESAGLLGNEREIDRAFPVIKDLVTGIQWASSHHWGRDFGGLKDRVLAEQVEGVVQGCWVSSDMGAELNDIHTVLLLETDSQAPYR